MSGAGRAYTSNPEQSARYAALFGVYKEIYPALRDQFAHLKDVMDELG